MSCHSLSPSRGGGGSSTEWPDAGGPGGAPGAWRQGEQQEGGQQEGEGRWGQGLKGGMTVGGSRGFGGNVLSVQGLVAGCKVSLGEDRDSQYIGGIDHSQKRTTGVTGM